MNKTWQLTKSFLTLQIATVVGMLLAMWLLEGISEGILRGLERPAELPLVMSVAEMTSYMFFISGIFNFSFLFKKFLVHGLTRKTLLQSYILGTIVSIAIYTIIMGGIMLFSNLGLTSDLVVYYLIKMFFDGFISFLLGSIIIFGFYRSKKIGILLIIPALIGLIIKIYIWLDFAGFINPAINSADFNIVVSTLASIIFSSILYVILKYISKKMPIKI